MALAASPDMQVRIRQFNKGGPMACAMSYGSLRHNFLDKSTVVCAPLLVLRVQALRIPQISEPQYATIVRSALPAVGARDARLLLLNDRILTFNPRDFDNTFKVRAISP